MQALDPNFEKRIRESFRRQHFMKFINAGLTEIRPGFCEIQLPFSEDLTQQHGFFHAGIVSTIADNAAGYAAFSLMEATSSILTVEFKINLMSPADGEILIGRAKVLKPGKTLTVCQAEVFVKKDGAEKLCAVAQSTLMQLRDRTDGRTEV